MWLNVRTNELSVSDSTAETNAGWPPGKRADGADVARTTGGAPVVGVGVGIGVGVGVSGLGVWQEQGRWVQG